MAWFRNPKKTIKDLKKNFKSETGVKPTLVVLKRNIKQVDYLFNDKKKYKRVLNKLKEMASDYKLTWDSLLNNIANKSCVLTLTTEKGKNVRDSNHVKKVTARVSYGNYG